MATSAGSKCAEFCEAKRSRDLSHREMKPRDEAKKLFYTYRVTGTIKTTGVWVYIGLDKESS